MLECLPNRQAVFVRLACGGEKRADFGELLQRILGGFSSMNSHLVVLVVAMLEARPEKIDSMASRRFQLNHQTERPEWLI